MINVDLPWCQWRPALTPARRNEPAWLPFGVAECDSKRMRIVDAALHLRACGSWGGKLYAWWGGETCASWKAVAVAPVVCHLNRHLRCRFGPTLQFYPSSWSVVAMQHTHTSLSSRPSSFSSIHAAAAAAAVAAGVLITLSGLLSSTHDAVRRLE